MENEAIDPSAIETAFAGFLKEYEDEKGRREYHDQVRRFWICSRTDALGQCFDPTPQEVVICRLYARQELQWKLSAGDRNGLLQVLHNIPRLVI